MHYRYLTDPQKRIPVSLVITEHRSKQRLDRVLASINPRLSRTCIQKEIMQGRIMVNNNSTRPAYRTKPGDIISGNLPTPLQCEGSCRQVLPLIYRERAFIVISKPAGMVVHPVKGSLRDTVLNALRVDLGAAEVHMIHRLDRDTTGVLVVALARKAARSLSHQFVNHQVEKEYRALICGVPKFNSTVISCDLDKPAITEITVLDRFKELTYVSVQPRTGRKHQIRKHLSMIGHPVFGDSRYGGSSAANRPLLHAYSLSFLHPETSERLRFSAPLPSDFTSFLACLDPADGDWSYAKCLYKGSMSF